MALVCRQETSSRSRSASWITAVPPSPSRSPRREKPERPAPLPQSLSCVFPHALKGAVEVAVNRGTGAFRGPQAGGPVGGWETFPTVRGEPVLQEPDHPVELGDCQYCPSVPLRHCLAGPSRGVRSVADGLEAAPPIRLRRDVGPDPRQASCRRRRRWPDRLDSFGVVMEAVRVPRLGRGRARTRPDAVLGDKAYSSRANRSLLRGRGIKPSSPNPQTRSGTASAADHAASGP